MIIIDESGDLVIKVVQYDDSIYVPRNREPVVLRVADFLVKKQVIDENSGALSTKLADRLSSERAARILTLKDDSTASMEIWLRTIHGASTLTSMVPIEEIWHLTVNHLIIHFSIACLHCFQAAGIKYEFDKDMFYDWFGRWYQWFETENATNLLYRELFYPCWRYDHARGFLEATRVAVYRHVGSVEERNPTKHYGCHLPSGVIRK